MDNKGSVSRTLDECLNIIGVSFYQHRLLIMCGLMFMADSMETALLSFISICAGDTFHLNNAQIASISSSVFAGEILGSLFWGPVADKYGRKLAFIAACAVMTVGGLLSGLSPDFFSLVAFRAMVGFGVGGSTIPFDLMAEFLPAEERGGFLMFIEYFWTVGGIFVICMAWWLLKYYSWRILAMVTCLPIGIACIYATFYLPESPRWLLIKDRRKDAEAVVESAAKLNGVDIGEFKLIMSEEEVDEAAVAELPFYMMYAPLFERHMIKITIYMTLVWTCSSFVYTGLIFFVIRSYSSESGSDEEDNGCSFNYPPILESSAAEFFGTTVVILVINKLGRVRSQVMSYTIGAIAVLLMGFSRSDKTMFFVFAMIGRAMAMGSTCATWVRLL